MDEKQTSFMGIRCPDRSFQRSPAIYSILIIIIIIIIIVKIIIDQFRYVTILTWFRGLGEYNIRNQLEVQG